MDNESGIIANAKRKPRPAQRLYVPPAQRNKTRQNVDNQSDTKEVNLELVSDTTDNTNCKTMSEESVCAELRLDSLNLQSTQRNVIQSLETLHIDNKDAHDECKVIKTHNDTRPTTVTKPDVDSDKDEMERTMVNINRKSRPLIKHVLPQSDTLLINVPAPRQLHAQKTGRAPCLDPKPFSSGTQVSNWEDLVNEDEIGNHPEDDDANKTTPNLTTTTTATDNDSYGDDDDDDDVQNVHLQHLDHVIELYDFPSSFRTQDLITVFYAENIDRDTVYIKWCDETHALLVLGTAAQATRALQIRSDLVKARPLTAASSVARAKIARSDLRPAMKRPETSMQTARRMITTALGVGVARANVSRERQAQEREALRRAKELKRTQRQNEQDAWEGNPRPSTT